MYCVFAFFLTHASKLYTYITYPSFWPKFYWSATFAKQDERTKHIDVHKKCVPQTFEHYPTVRTELYRCSSVSKVQSRGSYGTYTGYHRGRLYSTL